MTTVNAGERAAEWVRLWNARDVEGVLRHYHEGVVFRSPMAQRVAGTPVLEGKVALRAYWTQAVSGLATLHFSLDHVVWDSSQRELAVIYDATLNERQLRGCELMRLDQAGLVVRGEAFYGSI
jgi:steroid delta-isomerase